VEVSLLGPALSPGSSFFVEGGVFGSGAVLGSSGASGLVAGGFLGAPGVTFVTVKSTAWSATGL
jgi:hypothetical protein